MRSASSGQQAFDALTAELSEGEWLLLAAIAAEECLGASTVAALADELEAPLAAVPRDWLESLARRGLLSRAGRVRPFTLGWRGADEPGFALASEWRQLCLRASQRRGELERVASSSAVVLGERSIARRAESLQNGRIPAPARRRALVVPLGARQDDDPARELREAVCSPFDGEWFERTFRDSADQVAVRVLREALPSLEDCGELYGWLCGRARDALTLDEETARVLCQQALLREDPDIAERAASFLSTSTRLAFASVGRFQRGDLTGARQLLEQALSWSSSRGTASLPRSGVMAPLLALLLESRRDDGAGSVARRLLGPKVAGTEVDGAGRAFRALLRYGSEPEAQRRRIDAYQVPASASAWEVTLLGLTVSLHVQADSSRSAWAKLLAERAARWLARGYLFMARQAGFLAQALGGPALDRRSGELCVVDLIAPKPEWERRLERLARVSEQVGIDLERRLRAAWFVDMVGTALSHPALQEYVPESGWSAGRRVPLAELYAHLAELPPEDVRVLRSTEQAGEAARAYLPEAWEALIGHPRVFNGARGAEPVEVVRGECRIVTADEPEHLVIGVEPEGLELGVNPVAEGEARIAIYRVTPEMQRVIEAMPRGIRIPRQEERRALEVLGKLSGVLPVVGPHLRAERHIEADSTPCLRIACRAGAWIVEGGVRPFGPRGRFFLAGLGTRAISSVAEGRTLRTTRDLEKERARLSLLISDCPSLLEGAFDEEASRAPGEALQTWTFDHAGLLGLLAELADAPTACELEWGETPAVRVRGRVTLGSVHGTLRSEKGWYLLRGEVRLDEVTAVSLSELVRLPTLANGRFVELPNGDFLEVERRVRRVMAALSTAEQGENARELRLHESAFAAVQRLASEDIAFTVDGPTRQRLEEVERARGQTFDVPSELRAELRPYQLDGFRWLCALAELGLGANLADDMGLGKTLQILAFLLTRPGPALIVAPTSVSANWMAEITRFAPSLSAHEYGGSVVERERLLHFSGEGRGKNEVVIVSYALLQQDVDLLSAVAWDTVVLDEAQFIKNPASLRALAAYRLRARQRIAATGTPVENHLGDLWSIFHFLNPALLGSWRTFDLCFARPIERDADRDREEALRALVRPFVLRRLKSQVLAELPALTSVRHEIRFDPDEALRYAILRRQIHDKLRTVTGKRYSKLEVLAEITRLRRFCCHPRLVFPDAERASSKVRGFLDLTEELRENGHRALVFSQFVDFLTLVREELEERGIRYEYLDGSTPKSDRERRVLAFQQGDAPLFLISLRAGGFGLNLTSADHVIHLDPWWNPAVEAQATDRAHRIGQARPVTVFRLITKDSIEEQIVDLHESKRRLADQLLEGGEAAAKLDTGELLALIERGER